MSTCETHRLTEAVQGGSQKFLAITSDITGTVLETDARASPYKSQWVSLRSTRPTRLRGPELNVVILGSGCTSRVKYETVLTIEATVSPSM